MQWRSFIELHEQIHIRTMQYKTYLMDFPKFPIVHKLFKKVAHFYDKISLTQSPFF